MESGVLSSFGGNLAAMGLAGTLFFFYKVLRRAKCQSHNNCCDFELTKEETKRDDRIFLRIIESLRKGDGPHTFPMDHARREKGRPGDEGSPV